MRQDERSHRDLLLAIDEYIKTEARGMLASHNYLAEEAAQETLLGVERKIVSNDPPNYPAAYIRKVLSNRVATLLQRETSRQAREERYWTTDVDEIDLTAGSEWHDFLESLRQAVSDDEFWTLVLHYHFDFSYVEIGELLEKDPGAIRQIAVRGRRKCRERMGRLEGRVPAWVGLPDLDSQSGWRESASDSADGPRRPSAESGEAGHSEPTSPGGAPNGILDGAPDGMLDWQGAGTIDLGPGPTAGRSSPTEDNRRSLLMSAVQSTTLPIVDSAQRFVKRWLLGIPTSVLPVVALVTVPAMGFAEDLGNPVLVPAPAAVLAGVPESSGSRGDERGASGADPNQREERIDETIEQQGRGPATPDSATVPDAPAGPSRSPGASPPTSPPDLPAASPSTVQPTEPTVAPTTVPPASDVDGGPPGSVDPHPPQSGRPGQPAPTERTTTTEVDRPAPSGAVTTTTTGGSSPIPTMPSTTRARTTPVTTAPPPTTTTTRPTATTRATPAPTTTIETTTTVTAAPSTAAPSTTARSTTTAVSSTTAPATTTTAPRQTTTEAATTTTLPPPTATTSRPTSTATSTSTTSPTSTSSPTTTEPATTTTAVLSTTTTTTTTTTSTTTSEAGPRPTGSTSTVVPDA